jgi:eukaryotic-like serine/threonine-protein kinase
MRPLSHGGMGSIWVAQHLQLETPVAIKFMRESYAKLPALRARFEREARTAAQLNSPHVVHVYDFGFEEDVPYLVMELLRGEDLHERLQRCGRLPLPETLRLLIHAGRALRSVHDAGLVHRDLKPANFFLARVDGQDEEILKLLDFGIAKETSPKLMPEISTTGEVMGSPSYMSPEQLRAERDIDARSDLWALGVILFRMLTGQLPFQGEVIGHIVTQIMVAPIPSARQFVPDLPPELDAFFQRALAREREARFAEVREMVNEFARAIGAPPTAFRPSDPFLRETSPPDEPSLERWYGSARSAAALGLAEETVPIVRRSTPGPRPRGIPQQEQSAPPGTLTDAVSLATPLRARAAFARVTRPVALGATIAVVGIGLGIAALSGVFADRATAASSVEPALQASPPAATASIADFREVSTVTPSPSALPFPSASAAGSSEPDPAPPTQAAETDVPSATASPSAASRAPHAPAQAPRKAPPLSPRKPGKVEPDWGL